MRNFQTKLELFNHTNYSELLYEFGITSDEIKDLIIEQFKDYFQNRRNLEENAINHLTTIWFSYLSIQRDQDEYLKYIRIIIEIFNSAKNNKEELTLKAYAKWYSDFSQSITRFWSIYFGQKKN